MLHYHAQNEPLVNMVNWLTLSVIPTGYILHAPLTFLKFYNLRAIAKFTFINIIL